MITFADHFIYDINRPDGPSVIRRGFIGISKEWYTNKTVIHNSSGLAVIDKYISCSYRTWFHYNKHIENEFFENIGIDPHDPSDEELLIIQMHLEN